MTRVLCVESAVSGESSICQTPLSERDSRCPGSTSNPGLKDVQDPTPSSPTLLHTRLHDSEVASRQSEPNVNTNLDTGRPPDEPGAQVTDFAVAYMSWKLLAA